MSGLRKLIVRREIELSEEGIIATIRESETGGPVRPLITGREPHPTGRPLCIKAGHRSLPWESIKVEYPSSSTMLLKVPASIGGLPRGRCFARWSDTAILSAIHTRC
jgi:hypothetical protein